MLVRPVLGRRVFEFTLGRVGVGAVAATVGVGGCTGTGGTAFVGVVPEFAATGLVVGVAGPVAGCGVV